MFETVLCEFPQVNSEVLESLIELAVEIAREGREGRRIGTMFTLGAEEEVLAQSRQLILDPLFGHPAEVLHITDPNLRGTIKELAQLDGAFVVSRRGVFVSACRYLNAAVGEVDLPLGLGSRHVAGASITKTTKAVAIVVSESAVVRMFCHGELKAEIIPELWLLNRSNLQLRGVVQEEHERNLAILTPKR
jgi:diadenylate cyclase